MGELLAGLLIAIALILNPPPEPMHYKNCTELRKDHPQGVSSDHPAYRSGLDRDKDGKACETV